MELTEVAAADFGVRLTFHRLPSGPPRTDTIERVRGYMLECGATTASEVAAMWQQELDEGVLSQ
ncbi:MAG TPA: hypothetical protein PLF56_07725 [Micropruina sp.]|nr:hypothetical protein [Micropruina sp.]